MIRVSLTRLCLTAALLPLLGPLAALGQDDEEATFDRTPEDCVITSRIDQTEPIDDQNIIFYMRGDRAYRNTLPRTCPGLLREGRIAWATHTSRLCSIDTITVLEDYGVGFRPGFTCRLGEFVPLSPAEIEDIDLRKRGEAGQSAIETTEVEIDNADGAAESAESAEGEAADDSQPEPADDEN